MLHVDTIRNYYKENGKAETLRWIRHYGYTRKEANTIFRNSLVEIELKEQKPF